MIMLRTTARLAVPNGIWSFWELIAIIALPLATCLARTDEGPIHGLLLGFQLMTVIVLGLRLRGPVSPRGAGANSTPPMPTLPVSAKARLLSVVLVGEVMLLCATVGVTAALAWGSAAAPGWVWPPAVQFEPRALAPLLVPLCLVWAPFLAIGASRALTVTWPGGIGLAGLVAVPLVSGDRSVLAALVWCAAALPLALQRTTSDPRTMPRAPPAGGPARHVLGRYYAQTFLMSAGLGAALTVGPWLVGCPIAQAAVIGGGSAAGIAALVPVLPPSWRGGPRPSSLEPLAWLPISRKRVVATVLLAALARTLLIAALGWLLSAPFAPDGPTFNPLALLAAASCLCASTQLAGLPDRHRVALPGILLGALALGGSARFDQSFPVWVSVGLPAAALLYVVAVATWAVLRPPLTHWT